jgi:hypothetical protein
VVEIRDSEELDIGFVPEEMFLDDAKIQRLNVGAGDNVYIAGLFTFMAGRSQILPIVRTGNVALIPPEGELLPGVNVDEQFVEAEAYLIEARSLGGLSGSPAFVRSTIAWETTVTTNGEVSKAHAVVPGQLCLLGLMHGHWDIPVEDINDPSPTALLYKKPGAVNLGLAKVVPAKKIREVLYRPELVEGRAEADRRDLHQHPLTLDYPQL